METIDPNSSGQKVLDQTLLIMQPLVRWLLRAGVGYGDFSQALKVVFLREAEAELQRIDGKRNDSTRSMLSGLHRKDVRALMPVIEQAETGASLTDAVAGRPTLAAKTVARWLGLEWPLVLPFAGEGQTFEALVRGLSQDVHPRAVLLELQRLGAVTEDDAGVRLQRGTLIPDADQEEGWRLLSGSVADHLAAGVENVTAQHERKFLEQSVFADGLHPESIALLEKLATELWLQVMKSVIQAATPLCEQDEPEGGDRRIRVGMFCYSAPITASPVTPDAKEIEEDAK